MTTLEQAAQRLIDALRQQFCEDDFGQSVREAFAAMREALEQPESEKGCAECGKLPSDGWALYCVKCSEPMQKWTGLTDDEIALIVADCSSSAHRHDDFSFALAIEAKLKELNT